MSKKKELAKKINIENNQFYGVKWDIESLELLKIVATGLVNLTELFKSQNITIESLLKVGKIK